MGLESFVKFIAFLHVNYATSPVQATVTSVKFVEMLMIAWDSVAHLLALQIKLGL